MLPVGALDIACEVVELVTLGGVDGRTQTVTIPSFISSLSPATSAAVSETASCEGVASNL